MISRAKKEAEENIHGYRLNRNKFAFLQLTPVILKSQNAELETNVLLDTNSSVTSVFTAVTRNLTGTSTDI